MNKKIEKAGFEERCFFTGDIEMNYVEGPNNGPALVLIPAQMGTWESYQRVLPSLSLSFQVFAVDIRGHGRIYEELDHAEALQRVKCPVLVLHANWFRHPRYGLVGAMDDQDAARIQALVPHASYKKIPANHVIHAFEPEKYVREILSFAEQIHAPG